MGDVATAAQLMGRWPLEFAAREGWQEAARLPPGVYDVVNVQSPAHAFLGSDLPTDDSRQYLVTRRRDVASVYWGADSLGFNVVLHRHNASDEDDRDCGEHEELQSPVELSND